MKGTIMSFLPNDSGTFEEQPTIPGGFKGPTRGNNSISYFKQHYLEKGLARPNRYSVEFEIRGLSNIPYTHAESVSLPSRNFVTIQEQWIGPTRTIPIGNRYDSSVVIAFPLSDDQTERSFFENWMNGVVSPLTNEGYYKKWVQENAVMKVNTLSTDGNVTSTFTFNEVYPSSIMPTQLDMGARNTWSSITVQFEYRSYDYKKTE